VVRASPRRACKASGRPKLCRFGRSDPGAASAGMIATMVDPKPIGEDCTRGTSPIRLSWNADPRVDEGLPVSSLVRDTRGDGTTLISPTVQADPSPFSVGRPDPGNRIWR